jgi:phage gpG-like protein
MGLEGDTSLINEMRRELASVSQWASRELKEGVGRQALDLIHYSFESSSDPEGNLWAPVHRGGKPLSDTGAFQASFAMLVSSSGFAIESRFPWAHVHNEGATIRAKSSGSYGAGGTYSSSSGRLTFRIGERWVSKYQVTIPARPFLPNPDDYDSDRLRWNRAFELLAETRIAKVLGMYPDDVDVAEELGDMSAGVRDG